MTHGSSKVRSGRTGEKARKLFGTTPEVVTVALQTAKLKEATLDEAKATVKAFLEKEVK